MTQKLPPLTALRAFESAGLALSFTKAAQDLGVTPGAISRQIRVLEDYMGFQLFVRSGREVSLTAAGADYLAMISGVFAQIRVATSQMTSVPDDTPLRITTSMTFTMRWLMPRLISFQSLRPDSGLQLNMSLAPVDFLREGLDATIKLGQENTPHATFRKLFDTHLVAVCSPRLIGDPARWSDPGVLEEQTLLHSTARPGNWEAWLNEAGRPGLMGFGQLHFESSSLAYQAAIEGLGVVIAQLPLVMEDLRMGKLASPFSIVAPDRDAYNLIWPNRTPRNRKFLAFRDWILLEAAATQSEVAQFIDTIPGRSVHAQKAL